VSLLSSLCFDNVATDGLASLDLVVNFFCYAVDDCVSLGLEITIERAYGRRLLHRPGKEANEFLQGSNCGQLGRHEQVVAQDLGLGCGRHYD